MAARYAPILRFDDREPFMPVAVGYTIFHRDGRSPSFPRTVHLAPPGAVAASMAVEYAIWWDWDIGHLYELEHAWVYIDSTGKPVRAEASWHGGLADMRLGEPGGAVLEGERVVLFSQPGKHAFAPGPDNFALLRKETELECDRMAGIGGVWITPLFAGKIRSKSPAADRLVHTYLERCRFRPSFSFTRIVPISEDQLLPWPVLERWIPERVSWWVTELERMISPAQRRWLRIGHRGAAAHAAENSIAGCRRAAALGADMVELDVQVSRDGIPVVIHDARLERTTTGSGWVHDNTLQQLKQLHILAPNAGEVTPETIPTLDEAVAVCIELRMGLYVDLKTGAAVTPVVDAIARARLQRYAIVGCTEPVWVQQVREMGPDVPTALLVGPETRTVDEALRRCADAGADYLHLCWESAAERPDQLLTPAEVERVHAMGKGLLAWNEERPEVVASLRRLGLDGICSARPELLV